MEPKTFIELVVVLVVFLQTTTDGFVLSGSPCIAPACYCYDTLVNCKYLSLLTVPRFTQAPSREYTLTYTVDLSGNNISAVGDNAFKNLSSINSKYVELNLGSNKISSIGLRAFSGIEHSLLSLILSNNNLTSLPKALSALDNLQYLFIDYNPLTHIDQTVLSQLSYSLTKFSLNMDHFQSWPYEVNQLGQLAELGIYQVPSSNFFPPDAFDGLQFSLRTLVLQNTQLQRIPSAICALTNLQELSFESNDMLNNNTTLFGPCKQKLVNLFSLQLYGNKLTSFPDFLSEFPSLSSLNLNFNQISVIHPNEIPDDNKITQLHLGNNQLSEIPAAINKLTMLEQLYMANNELFAIRDGDLIGLSNLKFLNTMYCPIEYVEPQAFKNNHKLETIIFQSVNLQMIPAAVMLLPNLKQIYFHGTNAQCTCASSYLKSWNVTNIEITGNCANFRNVPIKTYITTSLQRCA